MRGGEAATDSGEESLQEHVQESGAPEVPEPLVNFLRQSIIVRMLAP